jgi:hypothetical protein
MQKLAGPLLKILPTQPVFSLEYFSLFFFKHLFSKTTVSIDKTKDIEQNIGILTGIPHLVPGLCW